MVTETPRPIERLRQGQTIDIVFEAHLTADEIEAILPHLAAAVGEPIKFICVHAYQPHIYRIWVDRAHQA